MNSAVRFFRELRTEEMSLAGGKGRVLARLYQNGYPVPDGFIIMPSAFEDDDLTAHARACVQVCLDEMRKAGDAISFAIRSSAMSEDSSTASFAGQFETVLDVRSDDEVLDAIHTVRQSRYSSGVRAYSLATGFNTAHDIAVVVQQVVPADISGVLFTADPVSGRRDKMTGNFVFGLGEQLVSGKADAYTFTVSQRSGYDGAMDMKPFAGKLYKIGCRLEKEFGCPQDIEWAIARGKLYLLQSRPITTLSGHNSATGEWNDSMTGDFLWSNVNFGEAVPEVMTPLSWTVLQLIYESWKILPGYCTSGNIGGRPYLNLSIFASAISALGRSRQDVLQVLESVLYTRIPDGMEIPIIPLSKRAAISIIHNFIMIQIKQYRAANSLPRFIAENPASCMRMRERIERSETKSELLALWQNEIKPHLTRTVWTVMASVSNFANEATKLRRELAGMVGPDDADVLISSVSGHQDSTNPSDGRVSLLASLGPVIGIAKVARGEMDRAAYLDQYGHRGPNEFELSVARPSEALDWLDEQLAQFKKFPVDVEALLSKQRREFDAAWIRFEAGYPQNARTMRRRIDEVAARARTREAVRSEYVRDRCVARAFAVRAGQMTGLADDIFFLMIDEVQKVLSDDETAVKYIPTRKETYAKYCSMPVYPPIIRGRFDPFRWAADPKRRNDIYDACASTAVLDCDSDGPNSEAIRGAAGSPGQIEGVVRRLDRPEEGDQLQQGEILVTAQTDIAWTLLFPRAAAIITDVGAPLSHAAIVARELGIPAVVGCSNATARLRTGDRVLVDGSQGVVKVLKGS